MSLLEVNHPKKNEVDLKLLNSNESGNVEILHLKGPRGAVLLSLGIMIQNHPFATLEFMKNAYGDYVYCPWVNRKSLFLFSPIGVHHILKHNHQNYQKSHEYKFLKPLVGEGLLTSETNLWRQRRKLMSKEFHPEQLLAYVDSMHEIIKEYLGILNQKIAKPETEVFDVAPFLMNLTFKIAGKIFFGANLDHFSEAASTALSEELECIQERTRNPFDLPIWVPIAKNRKSNKNRKILNEIINQLINSQSQNEQGHNFLTKLLGINKTHPEEIDLQGVRDEVMTLMLAGHETTSVALMWTLWLLAKHPQWQEKILEELRTVLVDRKLTNLEELSKGDLDKCKILKAVLQESMRMYAPIPMISRNAINDDLVEGRLIEKNTSVHICVKMAHLDPRYWDRPNEFMPERFYDSSWKKVDGQYFPFALGPRACIGEQLAISEGMLILAYLLQNFHFSPVEGVVPEPIAHLTLRSLNGMKLKITSRRL